MKQTTSAVILIAIILSMAVLSSCTTQRGVRGVYQVKNGKHSKLTKGAKPQCIRAWQPQP